VAEEDALLLLVDFSMEDFRSFFSVFIVTPPAPDGPDVGIGPVGSPSGNWCWSNDDGGGSGVGGRHVSPSPFPSRLLICSMSL